MSIVMRFGHARMMVLLVFAMLVALLPVPVALAGQDAEPVPLADLAAMTLTPADLAAAGLDGYGLDFGEMGTPEQVAVWLAESVGISEAEMADRLREAGFRRWYDVYLYQPVDSADPYGAQAASVSSYALEFTDAEGAATAWEWIEDESGIPDAEDVPLNQPIGDQSEATRGSGVDAATGETYSTLDLSVRTGRFQIGVRQIDWTGEEPDLATSERLVARMLSRVVAALQSDGPALGNQAARLGGPTVEASSDAYLYRDGAAVQLLGESETDAQQRGQSLTDAGFDAHYRVWQRVAQLPAGASVDVWYYLEVYRFEDAATAETWIAGMADRVGGNTAFTAYQEDSSFPALGDESLAFTTRTTDGQSAYRSVAVRVGESVAVIDVQGPTEPPAAGVLPIAEAQEACLRETACLGTVPVPSALDAWILELGDLASQQATPGASPVATPVASPVGTEPPAIGRETYTSERFGYSVTWDEASWSVSGASREDGVELQLAGTVMTRVTVQGVEDFGGDAEACLDSVTERDSGSALTPSTRFTAPASAEGAVGGLYELGGFGVVYLECRTLVPGESVLQIRYGGPVGDYERALPALEDLLAGIRVGG